MPGPNSSYLQDLIPTNNAPDTAGLTKDDVSDPSLYNMSPHEVDAYNQYQQQQPAITGGLNTNAYYPDYNNNIGVGNYSGSIVGSNTIYAPGGGLIPLGMMDARDLAVKNAALQQASNVDKFRSQFKAPTSKLTNINESLTDEYYNYIQNSWQKALKRSNGNPAQATNLLKNDPNFWSKEKSYQDLAKRGDAVVGKIAHVEDDVKSGKLMSPALIEAKNKVLMDMNPNSENFKYLSNSIMRLDADREFSNAATSVLANVVSSKTGRTFDMSNPDQVKVFKKTVEELDPDSKKYVVDNLKRIYANSSLYSPDYIERNAKALTGWSKTDQDMHITQKRDNDEPKLTLTPMTDEGNVVNGKVLQTQSPGKPIMDEKTGKQAVDAEGKPKFTEPVQNSRDARYVVHDQATFDKPVKTVIPLSALASDLSTGKPVQENGNVSVEIGGVGNALVFKSTNDQNKHFNNMMVDQDADPAVKKHSVYEPVVPVKYTTVNDEGDEETKSEWVPLSTVQNALRGKGGANDKALQELKDRASTRTQKHQQEHQPPTVAPIIESKKKNDPLGLF